MNVISYTYSPYNDEEFIAMEVTNSFIKEMTFLLPIFN